MLNNLKGEIYKFYHSKIKYFSLIVLILYLSFVFYLYKDNININLIVSYNEEIFYVFLILLIYFISNLFCTEIINNTLPFINIKYLVINKFIIYIIYLIYLYILSFLILFIYLIIMNAFELNYLNIILTTLFNDCCLYLFLFFIGSIISSIFKKNNLVLTFLVGYLLLCSYIINIIIVKNNIVSYLIIIYLRNIYLKNNFLNVNICYILFTVVCIFLYYICKIIYVRLIDKY